jgi:6-phosphogluconolactonase
MYRLYIGTYTGPKSKGIYQLEFDATTGKLGQPQVAAETESPSFLAIHPSGRYVYAVNEVGNFKGEANAGGVTALAIESGDGRLRVLNQQSSRGAAPCHIVVDAAGKNVLVANYTGGSCGVLPIEADGKLGPMSSFVQHTGSSVDPRRQREPHAHSINLDQANRFAFVADLGLDKVLVYRYDGKLAPNDPPFAKVTPASGPRHFAFHPSGKFAYVINEITKTVTAFQYDAAAGKLTEEQTISTVPAGTEGGSTAEVVVHPSGKFLYGSNRGHNSIAVFTIDQNTGRLTAAGHQGEGIKTPRNFTVEPGGRFLLVANQSGDSLLVFAINQQTGALTPTDSRADVPTPVCIRMLAL